MTLIDHIRRAKESAGDRIAMIAVDRRWTYDEFDVAVQHLAYELSRLGIQIGDRVASPEGVRGMIEDYPTILHRALHEAPL